MKNRFIKSQFKVMKNHVRLHRWSLAVLLAIFLNMMVFSLATAQTNYGVSVSLCIGSICSLTSERENYNPCIETFKDCLKSRELAREVAQAACERARDPRAAIACLAGVGAVLEARYSSCVRRVNSCINGVQSPKTQCIRWCKNGILRPK